MNIRKNAGWITALIIPGVILLGILLVVLIRLNPGSPRYAGTINAFRIMRPDAVTEETIPDYAGVRRTYEFTIPDSEYELSNGNRLMFYLSHTLVQYAIEDDPMEYRLWDPSAGTIGKTPGKYWVSIPLSLQNAGKKLTITLTPVYGSVRNDELTAYFIQRDVLLSMIEMPRDGLLLILSLLSVTAGLFLILLAVSIPMGRLYRRRSACLGGITLAAGIWKLSSLPAVILMIDYLGWHREIWFAETVSYVLMMVLSLQLLNVIRTDPPTRTGRICFYVSALTAAVLFILQMLNLLELHDAVIWFGIGTAALHCISLLEHRPGRKELLWLLPFFLSLGIDLLICLRTGTMRGAPAFMLWSVFNLFVRGFGFVRDAILQERKLRKQEQELHEARIQSMISHIRPHFICNTLSSIYLLCREDSEKAAEVVSDFTDYLQGNFIALSATSPVSFSEELRHTKAYLAVEETLYGEKLQVEIHAEYTAFRLPPLTLQPLVENAIKHGINAHAGPLRVMIQTRHTDAGSVITVEDNGPGFDPSEENKPHTTLDNIQQRLDMMCGGRMDIRRRDGGGTAVTVTIPDRKEEE